MREFRQMFGYGRMWLALFLCAGAFLGVSLIGSNMVLIPGFSTFRPVNGLPVTLGLMFGPAGALGVAAGNVAGDIVNGTLSLASIGGAIGNFLFAFIPYKIWGLLRRRDNLKIPNIFSLKKLLWFVVLTFAGIVACTLTVSIAIALAGGGAFGETFRMIYINNIVGGYVVGMPLFLLLPFLVDRTDMYWKQVMKHEFFAYPRWRG
ncbi:hypothetical protein LJC56_03150 [Christensenellaceae bacterium OttesenSCG-928-K19]|nr:hypothetical protein [Christensenellaceae bacterium OttesenSCG-928-K19]